MGDDKLATDECPDDLVFTDHVMSVAFHPAKNIVAASTVRPRFVLDPHTAINAAHGPSSLTWARGVAMTKPVQRKHMYERRDTPSKHL